MTISRIAEHDKRRQDIYIDGEYAFCLYNTEVRKYKLAEEEDISPEVYDEIVGVVLTKRATLRAMNLLQKKDYSEYKLREKLVSGGYPELCIDSAIEYVRSYNYLDDRRYATDYINCYKESRSSARVYMDLVSKGIDRELIKELMDELYESGENDPQIQQIAKILKKKHFDPSMDYKERQKIMAFLFRKGYATDLINRGITEFLNDASLTERAN
ncbi:regulatory protein RecX [Butyrivibrio sp. MC2013]|uniref:regulatory protein RecX n=1 Tax=Butyrivibrio sp. MC2013 TaxID=1280686 RepID=UPI0003FA17E1|nr:regulatory protein RecX [Butyrivibrio sp. MC2013]